MENYVLVRSTSTFFTWQMFGDFFLKMHISLHVYCNPTVSWLLFCLDQFHWLTMFSENAHLPLHVLHALHVYCHPIGFYFVWINFIGWRCFLKMHITLHVYCIPIGFYFVWINFIGRKYCTIPVSLLEVKSWLCLL